MLLHRRGLMIAATQPAGGTGGGALPAMTWDTSSTGGSVSFTNGNLTATTSGGTASGTRSSRVIPSGALVYAEFHVDALIDAMTVGIIDSSATYTPAFWFNTASTHTASVTAGLGMRYNTTTQGISGASTGSIIGLAYNDTTKKLYASVAGVYQNSADPVAGTGGLDLTGIGGTVYFGFQGDSGDKVTANFAGSFATAAPSGYGPA